ncbi:MAG: hypothetical protein HC915_15960 [Anaerolineae bacterium]|nr:hypothetical protein [Anaerolineae bacterium]
MSIQRVFWLLGLMAMLTWGEVLQPGASYAQEPPPEPTLDAQQNPLQRPNLLSTGLPQPTPLDPFASATPSPSATPTRTPTATPTPVPINVSNVDLDAGGTQPNFLLLLVGGVLIGLLAGYAVLYARNAAALDRYAGGFAASTCPACGQGRLEIEERFYRTVGIPRVRRTVRCDNCRSILREVGQRRWRYAVDPYANPELFAEYNDKILTEQAFLALAPPPQDRSPAYLENDDFPTNR